MRNISVTSSILFPLRSVGGYPGELRGRISFAENYRQPYGYCTVKFILSDLGLYKKKIAAPNTSSGLCFNHFFFGYISSYIVLLLDSRSTTVIGLSASFIDLAVGFQTRTILRINCKFYYTIIRVNCSALTSKVLKSFEKKKLLVIRRFFFHP